MEIIDHDLKGNKNYFELAEDSSYRGFELPRLNDSKCMNEIQGKSILVRVSREGSSYQESTGFLVNYNEPSYLTGT